MSTFIADHLVSDGRVRIALRRPAGNLAGCRPFIECDVIATFALQSQGDVFPAYSVTWLADADKPFPAFAGRLTAEKCRPDDCIGLTLSGSYTPSDPSVAPPVRGRDSRIARVSVRGVLQAVATHVRVSCAHHEAAMAGHRRYIAREPFDATAARTKGALIPSDRAPAVV